MLRGTDGPGFFLGVLFAVEKSKDRRIKHNGRIFVELPGSDDNSSVRSNFKENQTLRIFTLPEKFTNLLEFGNYESNFLIFFLLF